MECLADYMEEQTRQKCYRGWRSVAYGANAVFALFAILLIAIGGAAIKALSKYDFFYKNSIPSGLVVLGVFMIIVVVLGFVGMKKKHKGMLIAYLVLMLILIICEFGVGGGAIALRNDLPSTLQVTWDNSTDENRNVFQKDFVCCGWENPDDFPGSNCFIPANNTDTNTTTGGSTTGAPSTTGAAAADAGLFARFAMAEVTTPGGEVNNTVTDRDGCKAKFLKNYRYQLYSVGTVGILFATFQIIGFIATAIVLDCVRFEKNERRYGGL